MEVGVLVGVMVGDGMGVAVGVEAGVEVGLVGNRAGRLQAVREMVNNRIGSRSFFMGRTILGRGRGVKEGEIFSN
jgi:hypothetical protein